MIELPVCRWRGEPTIPEHYTCASPKLVHGVNGVHASLCPTCYLRDHEPVVPAQPQPDAHGRVTYGCHKAKPLRWWQRAWHFAQALFVHAAAGDGHVPERVFRERLTKCKTSGRGTSVNGTWTAQPCPHYWERPQDGPPPRWPRLRRLLVWVGMKEEDLDRGCEKCECSGLKLRWPSQKCPIGKWDVYQARPPWWRRVRGWLGG